jgi:hypothetical protein
VNELLWILGGLAAIVVVSMLTFVLILRAMYRRVRRSPALRGAVLRTRAGLSRGPQRKVLELRLQLKEALESGQAAVDLASRSEWPRGELPRLYRRVQNEGLALDAQLRLMESETESEVLVEELPMARQRVDQVAGMVRRVRSAVASGAGGRTSDTLAVLRADVDREVAALRAGTEQLHELYVRDGVVEPERRYSADRIDQSR